MWKDIITDLVGAGVSQRKIAELAHVSQAHISDLSLGKKGKRIGFDLGTRLVEIHAQYCPDKARQAVQPKEPA